MPTDSRARQIPILGAGVVNRGFSESRTVQFNQPSPGDWSLVIDDEPIPQISPGIWEWTPGFFAGTVEGTLFRGGNKIGQCLFDVSPDSSKLGSEAYNSLLDDIRDVDPALLFGEEPAQGRVGTLGTHQDPWLEFQRLRVYGPVLRQALESIIRAPIRSLRHQRRLVPFNAIHRVDRTTAVTALLNGTAAALGCTLEARAMGTGLNEPLFDVPATEEHFDGAANRCIFASLIAVLRRSRALLHILEEKVAHERTSETRSPLAARWPTRRRFLTEFGAALSRLQKRDPFSSITRPEITAAGLNAISAHPGYSRANRLCWQALRPGIAGDETQENMWLSPTWELYERWVFARLAKLGEELCSSNSGFSSHLAVREWTGKLADGWDMQILLQPTFPAFDQRKSGFRSLSGRREPDLVLTLKAEDRQRFLVMDAKYRTSRSNVLDAMASAHIYRDALRWDTGRADYALLVVPAAGGAPWLEAPSFREEHRVGVVALSPDVSDGLLRQFLQRWVEKSD